MDLLDRYIARQYLVNIAALTLIIAGFIVAIDVSMNFDRFVDRAAEFATIGEEGGNGAAGGVRRALIAVLLVADLWWPRLLQLMNFLAGILMVGGLGFTCAQLMRHRELLAMLSAGRSLHRVARPVLIVGLGVTGLQLINQEVVIPRIAPLLIRDHGAAGNHSMESLSVSLMPDGTGRLLRADSFDATSGELLGLLVIERGPEGRAERVIRAERARWSGDRWILEGGTAIAPAVGGEGGDGLRRVRTPLDALQTPAGPARITMERYRAFEQALGFAQVTGMLRGREELRPDVRERLERIRWGRFGVAACNLLALAIALPFFVARSPTDLLGRTLRCLPLAGTALVGGVIGASADMPGIPPQLSVFIPPLVLVPAAFAAMTSIRT